MSVITLEIFTILLLLINHSNAICDGKLNPSLGDLCLEEEGLLLVYYTDNFGPARWGTICDDRINEPAYTTICQQLGYDKAVSRPSLHNNIAPWFTEVKCDDKIKTQNILRCSHTPPIDHNCSKISLDCGLPDTWNNVPDIGYNGQVMLKHPKNAVAGHQVSFGLVLIHLNNEWGFITQNKTQPFTRNAADSVCRQMGYTEANPYRITTVDNSNTSYNLTGLQDNAWLISNNTQDCMVSSEACFSCCFTEPVNQCYSEGLDACVYGNSLVLQCLFDLHKEPGLPSEGNTKLCSISDYQKPHICAGSPPYSPLYEKTTISLTIVSLLLLIIIIVMILTVSVCCCRRNCKDPRPAGGGNPEEQPLIPNNLDEHQN